MSKSESRSSSETLTRVGEAVDKPQRNVDERPRCLTLDKKGGAMRRIRVFGTMEIKLCLQALTNQASQVRRRVLLLQFMQHLFTCTLWCHNDDQNIATLRLVKLEEARL